MRKILTGCIIATAIASVYPAAAQIFSYSYTDTNQLAKTLKPATQSYLNPASTMTLNLISGLDRYERVSVTRDSDKKVMYSAVTGKISVADRIVAADGTEYYGKDLALPALGEGAFPIPAICRFSLSLKSAARLRREPDRYCVCWKEPLKTSRAV